MDEKKKNRLSNKIVPPGMSAVLEIGISVLLLVLMFLLSRQFLTDLSRAKLGYEDFYRRLPTGDGIVYGIKPWVADINDYLEGCFVTFPIIMTWCFLIAFLNYASFYKPSKSIYLMKRLRNRSELHIRCLAIPLTCALIAIAMLCVLLAVYSHAFKAADFGDIRVYKIHMWGLFY